jgi:hypothetical protein
MYSWKELGAVRHATPARSAAGRRPYPASEIAAIAKDSRLKWPPYNDANAKMAMSFAAQVAAKKTQRTGSSRAPNVIAF